MRYLLLSMLSLLALSTLKANDRELFNYNKARIENSLNDLNQIEKIVNDHPDMEADDLVKSGIVEESSISFINSPLSLNGEPPLGIPSFFWGCIFGVAGMIVVLIMTDKDKNEIKQALYGCITTYIAIALIYTFIILESGGL